MSKIFNRDEPPEPGDRHVFVKTFNFDWDIWLYNLFTGRKQKQKERKIDLERSNENDRKIQVLDEPDVGFSSTICKDSDEQNGTYSYEYSDSSCKSTNEQ